MSVHVDHRFSLSYRQNFYGYLRQNEFVNRNKEHISFDQSILPWKILTKERRLTNSILFEYVGESSIPAFLSLLIVKIWQEHLALNSAHIYYSTQT